MSRTSLPYFDEHTEPLASRIATGLHKIGLAMKQQAWQQANEEGLSATQGQILAALVTHGALTGSELGQRLGVTLPTISDSVRVLVEKALITKSPDPRHPRASLLTPTKKGAQLGARARSWPEFMAAAVADLTAEEQRAFFAGVVKMIRSLQDQGLDSRERHVRDVRALPPARPVWRDAAPLRPRRRAARDRASPDRLRRARARTRGASDRALGAVHAPT
jgi:DNA-binding MarR family transcriptional regulator